jgi:succinate dehydrogenase/fumarate reductase flavoprotein subunit
VKVETTAGETQEDTDIVVVGSGAAGLAAVISAVDEGANVVLLEAAPELGGTTAISGGQPWVPNNEHMVTAGITDSYDDALKYLGILTGNREPDTERLRAFVEEGPAALAYLEANSPLALQICHNFSDYFADQPGGRMRGRTLDVVPYESRAELGEWDDRVRRSPQLPQLTLDEMSGAWGTANPKDGLSITTSADEHNVELAETIRRRYEQGIRAGGGAMVAMLLRGVLDRGVEPQTETRVVRLLADGERITGVVAERGGTEHVIRARKGVVLACGGFEWNQALVRAFLGVPEVWPISPPFNVGDGLVMGMRAGAALANMSVAWACPVVSDGVAVYDGELMHNMNVPRGEPGMIAVNAHGKRFVNEGVAYMHLGLSHRTYDVKTLTWPNASPVWLIFDQRVRDRISVIDLVPGKPVPDWVSEASSIDELARTIDVPAQDLLATVERWNDQVAARADDDFGRGTIWFEGFSRGGPDPETILAPIDQPPFYAMKMYDGVLGTAGGLDVDRYGQARAVGGGVVAGLYAVGNAAASVFGPAYPGAGATLGQALVFGRIAGEHAARHGG